MKEISIEMVVTVPETESESSVSDKFVEWVESNGWTCGGGVKEITDEN
jgi:hypothetical protein